MREIIPTIQSRFWREIQYDTDRAVTHIGDMMMVGISLE